MPNDPTIENTPATTSPNAHVGASQNFLHNIIDSVADPIFVKDQQHRLIEGNEALWKLLGRPAEEVLGKSDYDFFPKEEADVFWQKDQEVFDSGKVNINVENFTDASGKIHVISTKKSCFTMPNGEKFLVGVIRDITDMKRMQDKLMESNEARLKQIMDHSGRLVYIKDLEGRYMQANAAFLELIGRTEEEAIGKTNYDFFPKEHADIYRQNDLQVINSGKSCEFEQVTPSGITHTAVKFPLYDTDNKMYAICSITSDISERKKTELRLQQTMEQLTQSNIELEASRKDLERSNQDLERFATVVAHDLKSPLRAITRHLELISANKNNVLEARSQKSMGFVINGARRMRELIEALLEYSYLGFSEKMFTLVDCNKVLTIVRANLSSVIQEKSVHITAEHLPTVMADKIQLIQLFQNLIANAIKFCTATPHIQINALYEEDYWKFAVKDNGIGIAPHNLENIFLIFKRLYSEDEYPGAGVGLAICDRVVKNHKGHIWVESEHGKGATFFFTLQAHLPTISGLA